MDKATRNFIELHKDKLSGRVLEVGSLNVNGGVRDIIDIAVGMDMRKGPGVDLVCSIEDLESHYPSGEFDGCVSTGTLEHCRNWKAFIQVTLEMVKEGGWLVMTMAHMNKGRHAYPDDYWRLTPEEIKRIYPNALWIGDVGRQLCPVSIGWVVQKRGELGSLEFEPYQVP